MPLTQFLIEARPTFLPDLGLLCALGLTLCVVLPWIKEHDQY